MKLIIAIIKPFKLDDVRQVLADSGATGMTVIEARGCGRQHGHAGIQRGAEYMSNCLPRLRIEVAVPASQVTRAVKAIALAARTGHTGDGKIFVTPLEHAVRIRTGETGEEAISGVARGKTVAAAMARGP